MNYCRSFKYYTSALMFKKIIKISCALFFVLITAVFCISLRHNIFLKWLTGSARIAGKPVNAVIYTNGQRNDSLKVFHVDKYWNGKKADSYILRTTMSDSAAELRYIIIHLNEKWVGRPVSSNKNDFDMINGYLFQSETACFASDFRDDMKGYNFDPELYFNKSRVQFYVPPGKLNFDSVRIEFK